MKDHDIDLEWIKKKYLKEKLSTVAIAKLRNVSPSVIESRLTRAGVRLRSCSEAASIRRRKSKYPQLNDVSFLRQKYEVEKLSSNEIAKEIGCSAPVVLKTFKKHGIKARTGSQAAKIAQPKISEKNTNPKLKDKEWLYQKYIIEKKSLKIIAEEIGLYQDAISKALKNNDIPIRDQSEAGKNAPHPPSQYSELNDKKWLIQKYITKGLGIRKIAKLVGAKTSNSVRQALIKFNIPVRNISDGLTHNREEDGFVLDLPTVEGGLLGDASLGIYNKRSDISNAYFHKTNKFYDHVEYVAKILFPKKWKDRIRENKAKYTYKGITTIKTYYNVRSLSYHILTPLRQKWYPASNNFIKLIPRDLELTPEHLLHWFMDDGCSYIRTRRKNKPIIIQFCTDCFTKDDQEFLQGQLLEKFGIKSWLHKNKKRYRIELLQSQADKFYDIIGPCPVPSFEYKWK